MHTAWQKRSPHTGRNYQDALLSPEHTIPRRIVNLEYLTAEEWAGEYHMLASLPQNPMVKKIFFMPGFTRETGGLILDPEFLDRTVLWSDPERRPELRHDLIRKLSLESPSGNDNRFWITLFTYERDFIPLVRALSSAGRVPYVLVAAGRGAPSFFAAWEKEGRPFPAVPLPFLSQELFDQVLLASDFLFVRGEESLSRACISGRPFLWHAYPLEENGQMEKVEALLSRMEQYFTGNAGFEELRRLFLSFNTPSLQHHRESTEARAPRYGLRTFRTPVL